MSKFTLAQATVLRVTLKRQFEEWKAERLEARNNHIETLLRSQDMAVIKMRQDGVAAIDRRIKDRENYLAEVMKAIEDNTENGHKLAGSTGTTSTTNRKGGIIEY